MPRRRRRISPIERIPMYHAEEVGGDSEAAVVEKPEGDFVIQTREEEIPLDLDPEVHVHFDVDLPGLVREIARLVVHQEGAANRLRKNAEGVGLPRSAEEQQLRVFALPPRPRGTVRPREPLARPETPMGGLMQTENPALYVLRTGNDPIGKHDTPKSKHKEHDPRAGKRSPKLREAVDLWMSMGHDLVNPALRGGGSDEYFTGARHPNRPAVKETIRLMDAAIEDSKLEQQTALFRGIRTERQLEVGQVLTDKGFPSFGNESVGQDFAGGGKRGVLMEVSVPAGAQAMHLDSQDLGSETIEEHWEEWVLPRNSRFKITSIGEKGKGRTVTAELVLDESLAKHDTPKSPHKEHGPKGKGGSAKGTWLTSLPPGVREVFEGDSSDHSNLEAMARLQVNADLAGKDGPLSSYLDDNPGYGELVEQVGEALEIATTSLAAFLPQEVMVFRGVDRKRPTAAITGYLFVTTDPEMAAQYAGRRGTVQEAVMPKGSPVAFGWDDQSELILPRGSELDWGGKGVNKAPGIDESGTSGDAGYRMGSPPSAPPVGRSQQYLVANPQELDKDITGPGSPTTGDAVHTDAAGGSRKRPGDAQTYGVLGKAS